MRALFAVLAALALMLSVNAASIAQVSVSESAGHERVAISVLDGEQRMLKIGVDVRVAEAQVYYNNRLVPSQHRTIFQVVADVETFTPAGALASRASAPVTLRVTVAERVLENGTKVLSVDQEVTEVDGGDVVTVDVKTMAVEVDANGLETRRTFTRVSVSEQQQQQPEAPAQAASTEDSAAVPAAAAPAAEEEENETTWQKIKRKFTTFGERVAAHFKKCGEHLVHNVKKMWAKKPWGRVALVSVAAVLGLWVLYLVFLAGRALCRSCCCCCKKSKTITAQPCKKGRKMYVKNVQSHVLYMPLATSEEKAQKK